MLVFDTNIAIDFENRRAKTLTKVKELLERHPYVPHLTTFTYFELLLGLENKSEKKKSKSMEFLNTFDILNTTNQSAHIFSKLKATYDKKGMQIPLIDLLIAGLVIENGMTLVTRDKHFAEIKELKKIILE